MSEYTPDDEDVEVYFALGLCEYRVGNGGVSIDKAHDAYRAWLAAHDKALREQIADDLQTEAENLDLEVPNAHREGMREGLLRAVDIARGGVSR